MSQIVIITEDRRFGLTLKQSVYLKYGIEPIAMNAVVEAISMMELFPDVKVVYTLEKFSKKIAEFLVKNYEHEVQLIISGNNATIYPTARSVAENLNAQDACHEIGFSLGMETSRPAVPVIEKKPVEEKVIAKAPAKEPVKTEVKAEPKKEVKAKVEEQKAEENTTVFTLHAYKKPGENTTIVSTQTEPDILDEFMAINTKYLTDMDDEVLTFNVYSRIKKHDDYEYNVKFAHGTIISKAEIDRVLIRGSKEFYLASNNYKKSYASLSLNFLSRFKVESLAIADRLQLNSDSFEILLDVFKYDIIDKYSVEIIKELIKSMDVLMKSAGPYEAFQFALKKRKLSYGYSHCHLTCLLIFQVVDRFSWSKDQSKNKIIYLSLFHDLSLHNDRLIKIHHNFLAEQSKLSDEDKETIINHADATATILENIVKAPKELTNIIREHHGMRNGINMAESLSLGITHLSMAFMVTEDLVSRYLKIWEKNDSKEKDITRQDLIKEFSELKLKYDKLTYLDVVVAFEDFFVSR